MKNNILVIIGTVVFFLIQILLGYLLDDSIDWKYVIISSIFFAIFELCFQLYRNKKSDK